MFIIVCLVYLLVIVGLSVAVWRCFKAYWAKVLSLLLFLLVSNMFFLQRMVVDICPLWVSKVMYVIGTMWLVVVLYGAIVCALLFLARLLARLRKDTKFNPLSPILIGALVLLILGVGYMSAVSPRVVKYGVNSSYMASNDTLRFALVSDLHMGYAIGRDDIEELVSIINSQEVDFCVIAGDMVDGDLRPVLQDDLGAPLRDIKCPTYAVMGNHEYIGNAEVAYKYIQGLGVTILRDSVAIFGDSIVAIVGRDDVSVQHFEQRERKPLAEMVPGDMMSIVVDHQPMAIEESAEAGATLYLSGHTHAGQVWPMRMFTKSLFRCDYGMYGFENTVGVVTSGYGTWGPRIRLGSNSEVVIVCVVR